jgi:23S rRNA (uracil1939-C5)-methyltransferase
MSEIIDVRIDSIAAGGDGVGRHETLVVFVPRTAPGDLARIRATREGRLMRGQLLEILEPSAHRAEPECAHYVVDRCGGCQIQHLGYDDGQLPAKSGIIRDALNRIGRLDVDAPDVARSPKPWRYRTKLTLALRRADGKWIAGLHRYDAPDEVFQLVDCPITDERVMAAWRAVLAHDSLLPAGAALRGAIRLLGDGFSFTVEGAQTWGTAEELFAAAPQMLQLWWKPEGKSRRLMQSRIPEPLAGASFTQVNPDVAALVRSWVVDLASKDAPRVAVDAYSGTGDIAVALAERGSRVTAIEIDRDASRVCASRLPEGSRAIAAPVEKALGKALPADLVVVNPPRAGLDERVADILKSQVPSPKALIYVSCNPATLARDIRRMERFQVKSLRGFDMFPQTAHVETVCELVPAA